MINSNNINNQDRLNALIDRYFDGTSTEADEQWLRQLLTAGADEAPDFEIDAHTAERLSEVLAVMSFSMAAPETLTRPATLPQVKPMRWRAIASVAAAVAVVIAIGVFFLLPGSSATDESETQYLAYVDGREINDPEQVMALMHDELSDIKSESKEPQEAFEMQLDDIREGLKDIEDNDMKNQK